MSARSRLAAIVLLLLLFAQMAFSAPRNSVAFDETFRVTFGYAYLRTGDARLSAGQNPPLGDMLLAWPLLLRDDIALPVDHPTWAAADIFGFADEFLWKANAGKSHALVSLARFPAMGLALLLAALVFAGARRMGGTHAAWLALTLTVFDPNVIANGRIVGSDLSVSVFFLGAALAFDRALASDSRRWAALAGLPCGAAFATKYSALWLGPILIGIAALYPVRGPVKTAIVRRLIHLLIVGLVSLGVIWATFRFQIGPLEPGGPPVPAPDYWRSIGGVGDRVASSTPAFLGGRISADGFLEYYPIAFAVKTPLPALLLLIGGVAALIRRRDRRALSIALPLVVFFGAAVIGRLNLGYRLILPVLPFALIIAASAVEWRSSRAAQAIGIALIAWQIIGTLSVFPNHLVFFNELGGGPRNGYRLLVDSNFDWGQDLVALREWMDRRGVDRIRLAYFGTAHVDAYGVRAEVLPGFNRNDFGPEVEGFSAHALQPGWIGVSATTLQLGLLFTHWDAYSALRDRAPDDQVGSILLYNVPDTSVRRLRAVVLGPPAIDLSAETLGVQPHASLSVSWAGDGSAVLAMDGPARYITRGGEPIAGFAPAVHDALIAHAQRLGSDAGGNLRLFEIDARDALAEPLRVVSLAPVESPDGTSLDLPLAFEGGLSLIGYDLAVAPGQPIDLVTYWQVRQPPTSRLAVFAHVLDASGQLAAQGDGLNVRLSTLEPGDVILQHFVIDHPAGVSLLDIGLYDPASGERTMVPLANGQRIDHVRIPLP
ncbi:MAG TPA: phospholipid carrier-dependent glycosyltransferase [Anaerolineae bacterium]